MKADLTRWTFEAAKHYRTVRMQQGRVQLDADWNEQQDITHHRVETETIDVVGEGAVPVGGDFEVTDNGGDLRIAAGRAYVHGMLCENDALTSVTTQPDWPANASPILPAGATLTPMPPAGSLAQNHIVVYDNAGAAQNPADGLYLAYLEAWQRHLTLLEDPLIHEVALGDPDTATREKTVWQVKLMRAGNLGDAITCASAVPAWTTLTTAPDGTLAARSEPTTPPSDDCMLSPDAGFRSLSNLLYRVEIHDDGSLSKLRFKWSHDNGAIATKVVTWLGAPIADEFEVASIGRDDTLAIVAGCWVEFYDDVHELLGQPGSLVPVLKTAGNIVTVDLAKAIGPLDAALFQSNPRVRRWDGVVDATTAPSGSGAGWTPLESGVEVKLTPGKYRIGDYWLVPARVASADVEWPKVGGAPAFLPPRGVLRAFMRLGVFQVNAGVWKRLWDCRPQFPALSELTELVYIGGDGQEVPPNPVAPAPIALPSPLRVGVFNGQYPVVGADVKFTVSNGDVGGALTQTVKTGNDGVASASWRLAPDALDQTATAELLEAGAPVAGKYAKIRFSARLSTAAQVSYDPAKSADLKALGINNVQDAIDALDARPVTSGCCKTVGPGGDFPDLNAALAKLPTEMQLCLCLLPGQHVLTADIELDDPTYQRSIALHGTGVIDVDCAGFKFVLSTFGSVALRDLQFSSKAAPFTLVSGTVELENVSIYSTPPARTTSVQFTAWYRIRIRASAFLGPTSTTTTDFLQQIPAMKPFTDSLKTSRAVEDSFKPLDPAIGRALAALAPDARKKIADQIAAMVVDDRQTAGISVVGRQSLAILGQQVAAGNEAGIQRGLGAVKQALFTYDGSVLAVQGAGDILIEDSAITGVLCLGGNAVSGQQMSLPDDAYRTLSALIKSGAVTWNLDQPSYRSLVRLAGNRMMEIRMSDDITGMLKGLITNKKGVLYTGFNSIQLRENYIYATTSELCANHIGWSDNIVQPEANIVAYCVGRQCKFVTNQAESGATVAVVGMTPVDVANDPLTIVGI